MDMITQLRAVRNRYDEINNQLQDPTVINNNELYRSLMKDYKNLTPIVEAYDAYDAAKGAFDEAKEMLDEGGLDAEFKELAQAEYEENKEYYNDMKQDVAAALLGTFGMSEEELSELMGMERDSEKVDELVRRIFEREGGEYEED